MDDFLRKLKEITNDNDVHRNFKAVMDDMLKAKSFEKLADKLTSRNEIIKDVMDGENMGFIMLALSATLAEIVCTTSVNEEMAKSGVKLCHTIMMAVVDVCDEQNIWNQKKPTMQ